jgi:hypothetical protein
MGQVMQVDDPVVFAKLPAEQLVQLTLPVEELKVPTSQDKQVVPSVLYWPALQLFAGAGSEEPHRVIER